MGTTDNAVTDELMEQFGQELKKSLQGKMAKLTMPAEVAFHLVTYAIVEMKRVEEALGKEDAVMRDYFTCLASFFEGYGIEAKLMIEELLK